MPLEPTVEHLAFFEDLKLSWRTSEGVCVHGGLDPRRGSVEAQIREASTRSHMASSQRFDCRIDASFNRAASHS